MKATSYLGNIVSGLNKSKISRDKNTNPKKSHIDFYLQWILLNYLNDIWLTYFDFDQA